MSTLAHIPAGKITFPRGSGFHSTLKRRVDGYFVEKGIGKEGDWRLYGKTLIILTGLVVSYVVLVFYATSVAAAVVSALLLSQFLALVGLNIQHDGNHGSYARDRRVNWLMGFTLDLIGGSNFLWRQKHNVLHHTYTNIDELDDDLHTSGLLRLSPDQEWKPWHRFQHWYAFPIYSLLTLSWILYSDFHKFFSGRIGDYALRPPTVTQSILFFATKTLYVFVALVVPSLYHPFLHVLVAFVGIHLLLGLTLALVFQLAHTVEGNTFPLPDGETRMIEREWAIHEIETTADFARSSRLAAWYLGGLNFQIEHHLFPRISHVHYPAISKIVEETCAEFGISYLSFPTVISAVRAHTQHLKAMGSPVGSG